MKKFYNWGYLAVLLLTLLTYALYIALLGMVLSAVIKLLV